MAVKLIVGGIGAQQGVECNHSADRRPQPGPAQGRLVASRCQVSEGLMTSSSLPVCHEGASLAAQGPEDFQPKALHPDYLQ